MAKITIVDGDESNITSIKTILGAKEHVLNFIKTSAQLLEGLSKHQPDIIIIGVDLDGADGRELSRLLHTETIYKNIPVILTSPYYHTESEIRSYYCDDLVSMPFDAAALTNAVEALLVKKQERPAKLEKVDD